MVTKGKSHYSEHIILHGAMDINLQLMTIPAKMSNSLPSSNQATTISPPGPLSADHVQWIMASIMQLDTKMDNLKGDLKHQLTTEIMAQLQSLQVSSQPLQEYPFSQQQHYQPPLPLVFPQSQQSEFSFSPHDILD